MASKRAVTELNYPVGTRGWAQNSSVEDLLGHFNPSEPHSLIGQELRNRFGDNRFLVFSATGAVDVAQTLSVIGELLDGFSAAETRTVAGQIIRIYRLGESPGRLFDLHPLYGSHLRPDGTGQEDGLNWGQLSERARQLLTLAVGTTREIDPSPMQRIQLVGLFTQLQKATDEILQALAPRAFVLLSERTEIGNLPVIRTNRRPATANPTGQGDPGPALRAPRTHKWL